MKNKQDQQTHKLIPPDENKCIWMEAGYISFKLCDMRYDCAHCGLDIAMRTAHTDRRGSDGVAPTLPIQSPKPKEVTLSLSQQLLAEFPPFQQQIKSNLYYHSRFSWLDRADEKSARLGIDPFLLQLLGNVHVIVMPLVWLIVIVTQ